MRRAGVTISLPTTYCRPPTTDHRLPASHSLRRPPCAPQVCAVFPSTTLIAGGAGGAPPPVCGACAVAQQQQREQSKQSRASREEQRTNLALLRLQASDPAEPPPTPRPLRLHVAPAAWIEGWRASLDSSKAQRPPPLTVAPLLCACSARGLRLDPACALPLWARAAAPAPLELERDRQLARQVTLLTEDEAAALHAEFGSDDDGGHAGGGDDASGYGLPYLMLTDGGGCTLAGGSPECRSCAALERDTLLSKLQTYDDGVIIVQMVRQRPGAAANGGIGGNTCSGGTGTGVGTGEEGRRSKRPRRVCRSGESRVHIKCASSITLGRFQLLLWQSTTVTPAQQVLFFDGTPLGGCGGDERAHASLHELGLFDGATVELYVDESVPANEATAIAAIADHTATEKAPARPEDGFAGSVLLSASFATGGAGGGGSEPSAQECRR